MSGKKIIKKDVLPHIFKFPISDEIRIVESATNSGCVQFAKKNAKNCKNCTNKIEKLHQKYNLTGNNVLNG